MILEIRLSNIFSIRDEMVVDLQAANIQTEAARLLEQNVCRVSDESCLKSVALFGANASGKSNIIKGIRACVGMVLESHNYNENTVFPVVPFKFDGYAERPSSFAIRFLIDEIEYEYAFSMTQTQIIEESLYYYPNGRRSLVFSRDERKGADKRDVYEFKKAVSRPFDVATNTSRKTLFISRASQMDREIAQRVFKFFSESIVLDYNHQLQMTQDVLTGLDKQMLLQVLNTADSDIVDFQLQGERLVTYHANNPSVMFDFDTEESEGTKVLLRMMLTVLRITQNGQLLLIDEIDTSLHTKLVEFIINMFHECKEAQLLYTTHNTHLLNMKFVRRDQVYFVNKRSDGSSDIYSLYDFKDFRDTMDAEKAYLQGRFDAIPYIKTQMD